MASRTMDIHWQQLNAAGEEGRESALDEGEKLYDLSFAYNFQWDCPDRFIKETFRVLLGMRLNDQVVRHDARSDPTKLSSEELERVRWLIAVNPSTPPPVLDNLVERGSPELLERIAENSATRPSTLARLGFDPNQAVRAAVTENRSTPLETLWMLAGDEQPDVRHRLAENYELPVELLSYLTEDENPYVAARAQKTLNRQLRNNLLVANFPQADGPATYLLEQSC